MLDHIRLDVSGYERSRRFYEEALAPLGLEVLMEPLPQVGGFGASGAFVFDPDGNNVEAVSHLPE